MSHKFFMEDETLYLYLLTNTVNGKQYVGITSRKVTKRYIEHLHAAKNGTTLIARALNKYGREAFTLQGIGEASDWSALCQAEQAAILAYNTLVPHGYNMTLGGEGTAGLPKSPEHRAKIGNAQRGAKNHQFGKVPAHHAKMLEAIAAVRVERGDPRKGRALSEAHKQNLSKALTGKTYTEAQKLAHSKAQHGHPQSAETRDKIRAAALAQFARQGNPMQGKKHSEETKQRMAAARRGKPSWNTGLKTGPLSPETRAKLSAIHTGHPAWNKGMPWHTITGGKEHPRARAVDLDGQRYPSVMACRRATGLSANTIRKYIAQGKARYVEDE